MSRGSSVSWWSWLRPRARRRGHLEVIRAQEAGTGLDRDLLVYLPAPHPGSTRRYPVLYLQDGQNLFDPAASFAGSWRVDWAMDWASARGVEGIVVGIPNRGVERIDEYNPFVDRERGPGGGERYLDFLAGTVKPLVDRRYPTVPGRENTGVAGSSMGGLISLYAFLRRPDVFGVAGVLSPSLWFADRAIFSVLEAAPPVPGRIYLDIGRREGADTLADARRLRDALEARGYQRGRSLRYVEDRSGVHQEAAWGRRFRAALPFLLAPAG